MTEKITGLARLDYRSSRGAAAGLSFEYKPQREAKVPPAATNVTPYATEDNPAEAAIVSTPTTSPNNTTTSTNGTADNATANGNADKQR